MNDDVSIHARLGGMHESDPQSLDGELSDQDLARVVGGLARPWPDAIERTSDAGPVDEPIEV